MARDCMVGVVECFMKGHKEQGMCRMPLKMDWEFSNKGGRKRTHIGTQMNRKGFKLKEGRKEAGGII